MVAEAKSAFKKKRLNKDQKDILARICESIIVSTEQNQWRQKAKACLEDNSLMLQLDTLKEVSEISANHLLDDYAAAILYHSNKNSKLQ